MMANGKVTEKLPVHLIHSPFDGVRSKSTCLPDRQARTEVEGLSVCHFERSEKSLIATRMSGLGNTEVCIPD